MNSKSSSVGRNDLFNRLLTWLMLSNNSYLQFDFINLILHIINFILTKVKEMI